MVEPFTSSPEDYERGHVHEVYEEIAPHFSSTRYKPWPVITKYLSNLPSGSVGLDVGCGNGKNMNINPNLFILGSDRSLNLIKIAAEKQPQDVIVADILHLPHPSCAFDFVVCIAVIHHLSNHERRVQAIRNILSLLKPSGTTLLYVWALEQKNSRRGWDETCDQDVMVPWVMKGKEDKVYQRYYHLYRKGELESSVQEAEGEIVESGYEKDNWWVIAKQSSKIISTTI